MVSIGKLKEYKNNPRVIEEVSIEKVAESIDKNGFNQPIVVDQNYTVCVGHVRLLAAKKLGLKTVPVYQKNMNESEFIAYNLADNKTNEFNSWDVELLQGLFKTLETDDKALLGATGFSEDEISDVVAINLAAANEYSSDKVDDAKSNDASDIYSDDVADPSYKANHGKDLTDEDFLNIFFDRKQHAEILDFLAKIREKRKWGEDYILHKIIYEILKEVASE